MIKKQRLLHYYPLAIKLLRKPVVVIGGGKVAERKIDALRASGAKIRFVSPMATSTLRRLAEQKDIQWIRRSVCKRDVKDAALIVAATDDKNINEKVRLWAKQQGIWINVVDKTALCDFISPAIIRVGKSIVAVYTDGQDPVLSRDLNNYLKERWDDFLSYRDRL